MASNRPGLYSWEVGFSSPTSSQKFRLQNYPITPKNGVNTLKIGLINNKNPKLVIKTTL
jgi:hypothetical protein